MPGAARITACCPRTTSRNKKTPPTTANAGQADVLIAAERPAAIKAVDATPIRTTSQAGMLPKSPSE